MQGVTELRPEDLPQGRGGHEKRGMRRPPGPGLRIDPPGRDEVVDMHMVPHRPIPGMEDAHQANRAAEPLRIQGQGLECVRGGGEQQVIDHCVMGTGDGVQGMGQGERHEKIRHGQQLRELGVAPGVGPVAAAFGAMAVAAGVIAVDVLLAVLAPRDLAPHQGRAAVGDVPQRVVVAGRHAVAIFRLIRGTVCLEDVGQF